jgi:hypothetical protein
MSASSAPSGTSQGPDAQTDGTPTDAAPAPSPDSSIAAPKRTGVKTTRERAEEKRQEKLDHVREQQESGSLVIRQMTDEERTKYPARPRPPQRGRR